MYGFPFRRPASAAQRSASARLLAVSLTQTERADFAISNTALFCPTGPYGYPRIYMQQLASSRCCLNAHRHALCCEFSAAERVLPRLLRGLEVCNCAPTRRADYELLRGMKFFNGEKRGIISERVQADYPQNSMADMMRANARMAMRV